MKTGSKSDINYTVEFGPAAYRIFKKLPPQVKELISEKAAPLREKPLTGEPLLGKHKGLLSLHLTYQGTHYRIVYQVFPKTKTVIIRIADTRENIYRKLEEMYG